MAMQTILEPSECPVSRGRRDPQETYSASPKLKAERLLAAARGAATPDPGLDMNTRLIGISRYITLIGINAKIPRLIVRFKTVVRCA